MVVLTLSLTFCRSVEYYVTPDLHNKTGCPLGKPCFTLDYFTMNSSLLSNQENVNLLILGGVHVLTHFKITISNTTQLLIAGYNESSSIECYYYSMCGIVVNSITYLTIQNIAMRWKGEQTLVLSLHVIRTALLQRLLLDRLEIYLVGETIDVENSILLNCWLMPMCTMQSTSDNVPLTKVAFLESVLHYAISTKLFNDHNCSMKYDLQLSFWSCILRGQVDLLDFEDAINFDFPMGTTVRLELKDTKYYGYLVLTPTLDNTVILILDNCELIEPRPANDPLGLTKLFGRIRAMLFITIDSSWKTNNNVLVYIKDTNFVGLNTEINFIGSSKELLSIKIPYLVTNKVNVTVTNSVFTYSCLDIRKTLEQLLAQDSQPGVSFIYILLSNVTIQECFLYNQPAIRIQYVNRVIMEDCKVINNRGTGVEAYFSDITLSGNTVFANNTGKKGGALALYNSYVLFVRGANVSFVDNYAQDVGGGIYVHVHLLQDSGPNHSTEQRCFYLMKVEPGGVVKTTGTINMWFKNNYAENGGDDIYGGTLYSPCKFLLDNLVLVSKVGISSHILSYIFHFNSRNTLSSITSEPKRVCLCDDQGLPRCTDVEYILYKQVPSQYPGELFTVPAVVVGNDFGTVPGVVYAELMNNGGQSKVSVLQSQHVQEFKCIVSVCN